MPKIDARQCGNCRACGASCPVDAIGKSSGKITLDLGKCLFCGQCAAACPKDAIEFTRDHCMAARSRTDLIIDGQTGYEHAKVLDGALRRVLGRSLRLRQVSAGGCNACEADTNVLGTITYDIGRFGIQFVASPRHADGLLITGPVSRNMELAVMKTYEAVPAPKIVIAVGACAISGGMFAGHDEVVGGVGEKLPVDLFVPGCPPHPLTILDGLLRLLGRVR
jgi:Ni,Fe-hydrogenase III small subunit/NAD-dependent dihydropyrimidine dehydrogenase PreA subunit